MITHLHLCTLLWILNVFFFFPYICYYWKTICAIESNKSFTLMLKLHYVQVWYLSGEQSDLQICHKQTISMLSFTQTKWINCNMGINKCWVVFFRNPFLWIINRLREIEHSESEAQHSAVVKSEGRRNSSCGKSSSCHITNEVMMHAVVSHEATFFKQTYRGRVHENRWLLMKFWDVV